MALLVPLAAIGAALFFAMQSDGPTVAEDQFDANMPQELRAAVVVAYQSETDPAKLRAFRATLLPEYPKAAAKLEEAARMREQQRAAQGVLNPAPLPPPGLGQQIPTGLVPGVPLGQQVQPAPGATFPTPGISPLPGPLPNFPIPGAPQPAVEQISVAPTGAPVPMMVTTQTDPLNLRAAATLVAPVIGSVPKGQIVLAIGPAVSADGGMQHFFPLLDPATGKQGFGATQFLSPVGGGGGQSAGTPMTVTTQTDPLTLRSGPSTSAAAIGSLPRGSTVMATGPAVGGFFPVRTSSGQTGFASAQFLSPAGSAPLALPPPPALLGNFVPALATPVPSLPGPLFVVTTQTDPLNLRAAPSTSAQVLGQLPKGSTVRVNGPPQNGFFPVTTPEPTQTGWASAQFLSPAPAGGLPAFTAGFVRRYAAGASVLPGELQNAGSELAATLRAGECRATQEPTVRRFQAVARHAGAYHGPLHGFYDEPTRRALAGALGSAPRPACVTPGGPRNPDTYWVPSRA